MTYPPNAVDGARALSKQNPSSSTRAPTGANKMDNLNALLPILSRAFMKIENQLERQAEALERQADIAFVQLSTEQRTMVEALDEHRRAKRLGARGAKPPTAP